MRVYLPATLPLLARLQATGELGPGPLTAFAVTPTLRESYAVADAEELEYAASADAALGSLRLIDGDPTAPRRRVVIAADVGDGEVTLHPELDRAVVRLSAPVPLRQVAALLVDDPDAVEDVGAAAAVVIEADLGDDDAQFVVDGTEDHPLGWYAVQELSTLLDPGSPP